MVPGVLKLAVKIKRERWVNMRESCKHEMSLFKWVFTQKQWKSECNQKVSQRALGSAAHWLVNAWQKWELGQQWIQFDWRGRLWFMFLALCLCWILPLWVVDGDKEEEVQGCASRTQPQSRDQQLFLAGYSQKAKTLPSQPWSSSGEPPFIRNAGLSQTQPTWNHKNLSSELDLNKLLSVLHQSQGKDFLSEHSAHWDVPCSLWGSSCLPDCTFLSSHTITHGFAVENNLNFVAHFVWRECFVAQVFEAGRQLDCIFSWN